MKLNKEKLPIIYESLKKNGIDAWLTVGRETIMKSEPVLPVLGDLSFIIATTIIFTQEKCIAVVSPLDIEAYKGMEGIDDVTMETCLAELRREKLIVAKNGRPADSGDYHDYILSPDRENFYRWYDCRTRSSMGFMKKILSSLGGLIFH